MSREYKYGEDSGQFTDETIHIPDGSVNDNRTKPGDRVGITRDLNLQAIEEHMALPDEEIIISRGFHHQRSV